MTLPHEAKKPTQAEFESWSKSLADYVRGFHTLEEDVSVEKVENLTFSFVRTLNEILELAITRNRFKETWGPTMFMPFIDGLEISKKASRTQTSFEFGIDLNGFYFQTSPQHIRNLRYMDDGFWRLFLQLSETGEFDFVVNEWPGGAETAKSENKLKNGKSRLFTLLKNYLLFEFYTGETYPFGHLRVQWPFSAPFEDLRENLTQAVKISYALDYLLWKPTYQKAMTKKVPGS